MGTQSEGAKSKYCAFRGRACAAGCLKTGTNLQAEGGQIADNGKCGSKLYGHIELFVLIRFVEFGTAKAVAQSPRSSPPSMDILDE